MSQWRLPGTAQLTLVYGNKCLHWNNNPAVLWCTFLPLLRFCHDVRRRWSPRSIDDLRGRVNSKGDSGAKKQNRSLSLGAKRSRLRNDHHKSWFYWPQCYCKAWLERIHSPSYNTQKNLFLSFWRRKKSADTIAIISALCESHLTSLASIRSLFLCVSQQKRKKENPMKGNGLFFVTTIFAYRRKETKETRAKYVG